MKFTFLPEGPAVIIENRERILIIADLHFGIEANLAARGIHFRSRSRARLDRALSLIRGHDPDRLVLLGDIKHSIPSVTWQEFREMPEILDSFRRLVPLEIFPGNHDAGIGRFVKDGELWQKEGGVIDGVGYFHGHTYPAQSLAGHLLVVGHHHPLLSLRDEVGCALQAPAYLRAEADAVKLGLSVANECPATVRVLFVPSFNEIAGYDISRIVNDPFSPVSRCMDKKTAEVILADGTYVGPLAGVMPDEND